jgi:hypothetical protein
MQVSFDYHQLLVSHPRYVLISSLLRGISLLRSSSMTSAVSWGLLLSTAVLLHVKFIYPTTISYTVVLIPSYIMLGIWMVISFYVLLYHILKIHCYKVLRASPHYHLKNVMLPVTVLTIFFLSILGRSTGNGSAIYSQLDDILTRRCKPH